MASRSFHRADRVNLMSLAGFSTEHEPGIADQLALLVAPRFDLPETFSSLIPWICPANFKRP
jgi:hypothetical protein